MAMNTLNELKYYCNEKKPAGALMLVGEWGCGKTYLIEHTLSEELKDSHVFIRISLFGISSMDAVSSAVKQAWIEANLKSKGKGGELANKILNLKSRFAPILKAINDKAGAVLSLNIEEVIPISSRIDEKTVVLVFDDLERCRIDPVDLLGVINDYCENQKFHTIVIANEDYMLEHEESTSSPDEKTKNPEIEKQVSSPFTSTTAKRLSYKEIKEKIVKRTVRIVPDYNSAIKSIIENDATSENGYRKFLIAQTEELQNLFDVGIPMTGTLFKETDINEETLVRVQRAHNPHNIRSFRCAIQDFYRIFNLLKLHGITESLDEWLYAFVMFTMAHRAGAVADSERYGNLFTDIEVSQLYPSFYKDRYMLEFEKAWVLRGEWDEDLAASQIEKLKERQQAMTPYDIVRTHQLVYIDEEVFNEGFPKILEDAYRGNLTIDDYIQFIRNTASARRYRFDLPVPVDWDKLKSGVQGKLESMMQQGEDDTRDRQFISDNNLNFFTEEERSTYALIDEFRKGEKLIFAKNRKEFLDLMGTDCISAFSKLKNKRFKYFDKEMADCVVQAFAKCSNSEKLSMVENFGEMWELNIQSPDIDMGKTLVGFRHLHAKLLDAKNSVDKTKTITLFHFDHFIELAENLILKVEAREADTENT